MKTFIFAAIVAFVSWQAMADGSSSCNQRSSGSFTSTRDYGNYMPSNSNPNVRTERPTQTNSADGQKSKRPGN